MLKAFVDFCILIARKRYLIWELAKRDLSQKYAGSLLGMTWTVLHPMALIAILWFVFGFGLKTKPVSDAPFPVWLTAGIAAWFVLAEIVAESTTIVTANPHLIKKVMFPSHILPVVKVVSSFFNHMMFLCVLLLLMLMHGMTPPWSAVQFVYYYICLAVLGLGMSWFLSAVNVFTRDITQVVQIGLQLFFWLTPIVWDLSIMPPEFAPYIQLNPVYYIVQGYRESFFTAIPFWEHGWYGLYFWAWAGGLFVMGALVFRKLKPHFADVL